MELTQSIQVYNLHSHSHLHPLALFMFKIAEILEFVFVVMIAI